jgi:hypothetical protein
MAMPTLTKSLTKDGAKLIKSPLALKLSLFLAQLLQMEMIENQFRDQDRPALRIPFQLLHRTTHLPITRLRDTIRARSCTVAHPIIPISFKTSSVRFVNNRISEKEPTAKTMIS